MSTESIVLSANEDSILTPLMEYIRSQKEFLANDMINSLMSGNDRQASTCAARIYELNKVVEVMKEAAKEQRERDGDESNSEPTRITH